MKLSWTAIVDTGALTQELKWNELDSAPRSDINSLLGWLSEATRQLQALREENIEWLTVEEGI